MKTNRSPRGRKVFALLGADSLHLFRVAVGVWGAWRVTEQATFALSDGSADTLVRHLSAFNAVDSKKKTPLDLHWFLPPDILGVALVPHELHSDAGGLVLPYPTDTCQVSCVHETPHAQTWLWMHQTWRDFFVSVSQQADARLQYFHPRCLFFTHVAAKAMQQLVSSDPRASITVLQDGPYVHLLAKGGPCVRSFTIDPNDTHRVATQERIAQELQAVQGACGMADERLSDSRDRFVNTEHAQPWAALGPLSGVSASVLHRFGLAVALDLRSRAMRRVGWISGMLLACGVSVAAAGYVHMQGLERQITEMRSLLRKTVPQANAAKALKTESQVQVDLASSLDKLGAKSSAWQETAAVIERLPGVLAVHAITVSDERVEVQARLVKGKSWPLGWSITGGTHQRMRAVPDRDTPAEGGYVVRTYVAEKESP